METVAVWTHKFIIDFWSFASTDITPYIC